ncbi:hypothetical protein B0J18DRAFT_485592 [Chaetomium sp. MPI-SDFR-AT-0129]|nr:hypothetical protein B0J18DRAFT_485592 [Chaetomium sp. MPI-SDFR-AT-0129]
MTKWEVGSGYVQGLVSHHQVPAGDATAEAITQRLYSQVLSTFSTVVILLEEEFGGLSAVIHQLATWACTAPRSPSRTRPRVMIVTTRRKHDARRLGWELTVEILTNFNPFREQSFKTAERTWRDCFEGIEHVGEPRSDEELYQLEPAKAPRLRISSRKLVGLLRAAFRRFHRCPEEPFGLIDALRATCEDQTPIEFQLVKTLRIRTRDTGALNAVSRIIASAMTVRGYRTGLVEAMFSPDEVFNEFYSEPLRRLAARTNSAALFAQVYSHFAKFAAATVAGALDPVLHHQRILKEAGSLSLYCGRTCLSCLTRAASNGLSCGHRLCDACVAIHCQETEGQAFRLPACVFCRAANHTLLHVKPSTAGARVLRLEGPVGAAKEMAGFLRHLRSVVRTALHDQFDLVIASGIGMFFAVMLFCKRATIEECIHHLPNLECAKQSRWGLKFGRRLRFPFEELVTNGVRLCLQHERWRGDCGGEHKEALLPTGCRSEDFWPTAGCDVVVEFNSNAPGLESARPIADRLLASLFYIEAEDRLGSQILLPICVRCRLPSGQALVDLLMRARLRNARIHYGRQTSVLCSEENWHDATRGKPFMRRIYIPVSSPSDIVDIKISGLVSEAMSVSNCPYRLEALMNESPGQNTGIVDHRSLVIHTIDCLDMQLHRVFK